MSETIHTCVVCGQTSQQLPLLSLTYQSEQYYLCPTHLPVLLHQPQRLKGLLPGAEKLQGADHHDE